MASPLAHPPQTALRSPDLVMRLARMGSFHQCRLSFMRTLLRKLSREAWTFERPVFDLDVRGVGTAVYTAKGPDGPLSLVCFGHDLPDDQRSDRVIAHAWDATFALFDGVPTQDDIVRLTGNVPKQEAGRVSTSELSLSRANRSVRLFEHVLTRLAAGQQPDAEQITQVGYLMRTTAVYGAGKFGAADLTPGTQPFQTEMLTVFLIRAFTLDLVEHMARLRAPDTAVTIAPDLRRRFGVGNSTGLGMAPFIVNHPVLLNNWIAARETALARVRAVPVATEAAQRTFADVLQRAVENTAIWTSQHPLQVEKIAALAADLGAVQNHVAGGALVGERPWDRLCDWSQTHLSLEGQEQLVSLVLEPYGALVDDLTMGMGADEDAEFAIDGQMRIGDLRVGLDTVFDWALEQDWDAPAQVARVWYTSEEKLEPRLGERFDEPIEPYEQPLSPARDAAALAQDLQQWSSTEPVAAFLLRHPEHRHMVRRVQIAMRHPYAEIRDNTIAADMLPIDLLRCKLSFFGATHFDPRSDRWVRITMFQNAPFPHELSHVQEDDWAYPAQAAGG
ncbi:hypothetical protein [uncultured Tateyamaria sp.]|uniref:hypothetical protein n=1 Tax=uncultured Tateyamaria sp. TaxID=455651 RepID=UPI00261DDA92|nr:hypothetical protein [uncultured Tateyamaria sp.]